MLQVHVGGSVAVLGGKLYVSGGYDNTFELSDVLEAYDPETRTWSVVGRLPEPIFWHGSVSIFRQFMPETTQEDDSITLVDNTINLNRHPPPPTPLAPREFVLCCFERRQRQRKHKRTEERGSGNFGMLDMLLRSRRHRARPRDPRGEL
ncbi:PREDICTED: kelch-like protein 21 [Calidris pugnax]|uniref:kelch-like protein 21 n=1 Tax=Calidris pugnax TaxID=198806 RepID=UPI00071E42EF|nr:PREDICTED: kelch-like protein 21 [Calidris pugnax]